MDDRTILKKTLPFLLLFIFSLGIAGNEYVKQISAPTEAAEDTVNVQIANTTDNAPSTTAKWNVLTYVGNYFKNPVQLVYDIYLCDVQFKNDGTPDDSTSLPCDPKIVGSNYLATLRSGQITITSRESTQIIRQDDFSCGKVALVIKRNGAVLAREEQSKDTSCAQQGLQANLNSANIGIEDLIGRFARVIFADDEPDDSDGAGDRPGPDVEIPNTNTGQTIPVDNNSSVARALEFYNFVQENCGGTVNANNLDCLTKVSPPHLQWNDVIKRLVADVKNCANSPSCKQVDLQCVAFVRALVYATTEAQLPGVDSPKQTMLGKNFGGRKWVDNTCQSDLTGCEKPRPGDLIIFDWGTTGHSAFVTQSTGDGFVAIDANLAGPGQLSEIPWELSHKNIAGWLRRY